METPVSRPVLAALLAALALGGLAALANEQAPDTDEPLLGFVVGDYVLVGREPDGGAAYSGAARLEQAGGGLVLHRRVGGVETTARGTLEVPSPPGEGRVLRFRWQASAPMVMACLVGGDLDNFARLTCVWGPERAEPELPGLEALFPTGAWPDQTPGKEFRPSGDPQPEDSPPG
jgi:hypothetical protein